MIEESYEENSNSTNATDSPSSSSSDILDRDVLELFGIKDIDDSKRTYLYSKILETVHNRTMLNVYDKLDPDDARRWKDMLEQGRTTEAGKFLQDKNIDLRAIMLQEAILYKIEIKHLAQSFNQLASNDGTRG